MLQFIRRCGMLQRIGTKLRAIECTAEPFILLITENAWANAYKIL